MEKKFVKMNDNKNYVSLGNLFNIIKKYSKVSASAMQSEIFCSLFNLNDINKTTVNNYLIGYRAIGLEYKKIYLDLKKKYEKDKEVFFEIVINTLNILDECIYKLDDNTLELINGNSKFKDVCKDLLKLGKEDVNIDSCFYDMVNRLYEENNLYECFIEFLFYSILENKQPIYIQKVNINFRKEELEEYLKINLYEGISYISSLKELAKKGNVYANAELGSLEFSGLISGKKDFDKSFKYYLVAAKKEHPKACWMVANLILTDRVKGYDIDFVWKYLNRALELGSIAAINTMGNCYLSGKNIHKEVNEEKALEYYLKASEYGYVYAYNNIGLYYERMNNIEEALKYFKLSADLENSWALNKVGECLRKNGDLESAYFYNLKSIEAPLSERNYYGYYNLAKYYYSVGNNELGIEVDVEKAKEYFDIFEFSLNSY